MAIPEHIYQIIQKRLEGLSLTEPERMQLNEWYDSPGAEDQLLGENDLPDLFMFLKFDSDHIQRERAMRKFLSQAGFSDQTIPGHDYPSAMGEIDKESTEESTIFSGRTYRMHFLRKWGWAAAILIVLGSAAYFWNISKTTEPDLAEVNNIPAIDILPGSNKAILTLGDGRQISLDAASDSILIKKGIVNDSALLSYSEALEINTTNTLSTPRGGQYKLRLNDGTMVWLNAASSITYPVRFNGSTREVSVTGETYFEVAKNPQKPFIVNTSAGQITALGTQFNVNAYADVDVMKATLVEGSVKIGTSILTPGQAWLNGSVTKTDVEQDIAWKNGRFNFQDQSLRQIMNQLSRWYDLKVIYEPGIGQMEFGGDIPMNLKLSEALKVLQGIGIHFSLEEGNVLRVKP